MKCACKWIDSKGNPTPDNNEAIAMAVCYNPISFGEKGSEPFPICEEHANRKTRHWKLLPLPETKVEDSHELVKHDDRYFPKIITDVVINAIKEAMPVRGNAVLQSLKWDGINGCWYFNNFGMTNLEVAKAMVGNAIAYGKSGDLQAVMVNLAYIETLLEEPDKKNADHDWENFK